MQFLSKQSVLEAGIAHESHAEESRRAHGWLEEFVDVRFVPRKCLWFLFHSCIEFTYIKNKFDILCKFGDYIVFDDFLIQSSCCFPQMANRHDNKIPSRSSPAPTGSSRGQQAWTCHRWRIDSPWTAPRRVQQWWELSAWVCCSSWNMHRRRWELRRWKLQRLSGRCQLWCSLKERWKLSVYVEFEQM